MFARQDGPAGPEPDTYLLLSVARALVREERWALASRFVRIAGPRALTEGRGRLALQLYVLGRKAAARSGVARGATFCDRAEKPTREELERQAGELSSGLRAAAAEVSEADIRSELNRQADDLDAKMAADARENDEERA